MPDLKRMSAEDLQRWLKVTRNNLDRCSEMLNKSFKTTAKYNEPVTYTPAAVRYNNMANDYAALCLEICAELENRRQDGENWPQGR